jgi:hypothetical protein
MPLISHDALQAFGAQLISCCCGLKKPHSKQNDELQKMKYTKGILIPASIPESYESICAMAGLLTYSPRPCLPIGQTANSDN